MAHPQDAREKVRRLYVFEQLPLEMAALQAEVPIGTARRWKSADKAKGDDWDKVKTAHVMASGGAEEIARAIFTGLMIQYQAVIEQLNADNSQPPAEKVQMLTSMADAFNKAVSASAKVLPETNRLAVAMETVRAFGDYVRERHPARAMDFIDMIQAFAPELQKRFA
jgi:hypothetical protein